MWAETKKCVIQIDTREHVGWAGLDDALRLLRDSELFLIIYYYVSYPFVGVSHLWDYIRQAQKVGS